MTGTRGASPTRARAGLLLILGVSRVLYWAAGVRFDTGIANWGLQFLDPDLLKHHLISSVWYLHIEPPGFNLFLGLGYKLFGPYYALGFQVIFLLATVLMGFSLYDIFRDLRLSERWSFILTSCVLVSPTLVQYENLLFYTHFEVVTLVVATRCLQRWALHMSRRALLEFSGCVAALTFSRSVYQAAWVVFAAVVLLAFCSPGRRKALALFLLIPLVVGSSLIVKNWVVFGWPTNGTLEGLNLNRMSIAFLTPRDRKKMIRSGQLSVESQSEFPCVDAARRYPNAGPSVRNGALDRAWRSSDRHIPSWNYHSFVQCLRVLRYDAVLVIQEHPYAYFRAVQRSVPIAYYSATPDVRVRQANQRALRSPARVEAFALGGLGVAPDVYDQFRTFGTWLPYREEWVVVVAGLLCLLGLPWAALASRRRGDPARTMVAAFAWVVIVTTHVLTQLAETGENNRFRFTSDPVLLVGTVLVISSIRTARRARGSGGDEITDDPAGTDPDQPAADGERPLESALVSSHPQDPLP